MQMVVNFMDTLWSSQKLQLVNLNLFKKKKKNHNCKDVVSLPLNDIERIAELEICIPFWFMPEFYEELAPIRTPHFRTRSGWPVMERLCN